LIRHGETQALVEERLVARLPGVPLNAAGREQVETLASGLTRCGISAIYTGPLQRGRETAEIIGKSTGLTSTTLEALDEIDFGEWTGKTVAELRSDPRWHQFNELRSCGHPPGGESLLDVQARCVPAILELRERHDGQTVALVTHADVIRAGLAHFGGIPLDLIGRFEIRPASVTAIQVGNDYVSIKSVSASLSVEK